MHVRGYLHTTRPDTDAYIHANRNAPVCNEVAKKPFPNYSGGMKHAVQEKAGAMRPSSTCLVALGCKISTWWTS